MESQTVRVSKKTHAALRRMAEKAGSSMAAILEAAVCDYEKNKYWEEFDAGYSALRADPEKWGDFQRELAAWDVTLADGLEGY